MRHTAHVRQNIVVGGGESLYIGGNAYRCRGGREIPHVIQIGGRAEVGIGVAPYQLLHGVVERQTNQLRAVVVEHGITASVLYLLNQVLVTLLGETATLLRIQVDIVGPYLEGVGRAEVLVVVGGQVEVQAHLVVLQSNQGKVQTGVTVEEEQQRQVHAVRDRGGYGGVRGGRHLAPGKLVRLVQEQLSVQAPPGLVVLVNTLTTDRQLNGRNGTLGNPVGIVTSVVGRESVYGGLESYVHVTDQIAVTGNGHRHATRPRRRTVGRLLNQLHREVGVALVHRLEESHLGRTGEVNVLSAVSYELHKTASHV